MYHLWNYYISRINWYEICICFWCKILRNTFFSVLMLLQRSVSVIWWWWYCGMWFQDIPVLCRELPDDSLKVRIFLNMQYRKAGTDFEFLIWISYFFYRKQTSERYFKLLFFYSLSFSIVFAHLLQSYLNAKWWESMADPSHFAVIVWHLFSWEWHCDFSKILRFNITPIFKIIQKNKFLKYENPQNCSTDILSKK